MRILKFSTSHCGQCMVITERMRRAHIRFEEIDCERQPAIAEQYGIQSVPQVIILDDNDNVFQQFHNMPEILKAVSMGLLKERL